MPDLYHNGTIITMDDSMPTAEAVLVEHGRIQAVGSYDALRSRGTSRDLGGATLLPGFIDSHSHIGMSCLFPRFDPPPTGGVDSLEELLGALSDELGKRPRKKGDWFIGMGYDNAFFDDGRHPTSHDLDTVSTTVPIAMIHASGHVGVLNSRALEIARITAATESPEGGVIAKDGQGRPTGLLEETALTGILKSQGAYSPSPLRVIKAIRTAQDMYASFGITTAQEGLAIGPLVSLYRLLALMGLLKIDICAYLALDGLKNVQSIPPCNEIEYRRHFRVGGAKLILDGSPQAKTAWLAKPYHVVPKGERPDYCGYPTYENVQVDDFMKEVVENNLQVLVHCNGDAAADQFLNAYEKACGGTKNDARSVMVHAQTVREDQLDRMKGMGIFPTFFHDHTFFWGDYHLDSVLGPIRGRRISPLASALKRDMTFTVHQDTPVVPPNMVFSVHNAVNRLTRNGRSIGSEYAVDVYTALKSVTIWAAKQYHEEGQKGSIEVGKAADFALLDADPRTVDPSPIKDIRVLKTIKQGKVIFATDPA